MKISELEKILAALRAVHGDIEVVHDVDWDIKHVEEIVFDDDMNVVVIGFGSTIATGVTSKTEAIEQFSSRGDK